MLKEYEVLKQWKLAVYYANIACNTPRINDLYKAMTVYISSSMWESEGQTEEEIEDQIYRCLLRLQLVATKSTRHNTKEL